MKTIIRLSLLLVFITAGFTNLQAQDASGSYLSGEPGVDAVLEGLLQVTASVYEGEANSAIIVELNDFDSLDGDADGYYDSDQNAYVFNMRAKAPGENRIEANRRVQLKPIMLTGEILGDGWIVIQFRNGVKVKTKVKYKK